MPELSDTPSEITESKTSVNLDDHEESVADYVPQNRDEEFGVRCHEFI